MSSICIADDYRIYDGDGFKPSTRGLFLVATDAAVTPNQGYLLQHGIELRIGKDLRNPVLVTYFNPASPALASLTSRESISLRNRSVVLGRDRTSTLQLNSPIVSRRHCTIDANNRGEYVLKDTSANGVFINNKKVKNAAILTENAKIRIGPFLPLHCRSPRPESTSKTSAAGQTSPTSQSLTAKTTASPRPALFSAHSARPS